jgi:hypothetical protein
MGRVTVCWHTAAHSRARSSVLCRTAWQGTTRERGRSTVTHAAGSRGELRFLVSHTWCVMGAAIEALA